MKKSKLFILMALLLTLGLVACKKSPTSEEKASYDALYKAINLGVNDPTNVINSFEVPVSGREEGSTVTWKSSNEAVAKYEVVGGQNQITITRPAEGQPNAELKLTATIKWTAPSKHEFSQDKEFDVRVIAFPVAETATLKEVREGKYSVNAPVKVKDVIVVHVAENGYSVVDNTTGIFIYGADSTVKVGDKGVISAKYGVNFDSPQLIEATFTKESTLTLDEVLGLAVEKNVEDFWIEPYNVANDPNGVGEKSEKDAKASTALNTLVKFDGKVKVESSWSGDAKYKIVIYNADGTKYVRSYYTGLKHSELAGIEGINATFYAIPYTVRNDRPQPSTIASGLALPTFELFVVAYELGELTDEQAVNFDKETIKIETKFRENGTIELPVAGTQGTTITWESADVAAIDVTTGAVTVVEDLQKEVKLTATITKNAVSQTKEFTVLVGIPAVITIEEANEVAVGKEVKVTGVITSFLTSDRYKNSSVFIKDATGVISLFRVSKDYTAVLKVGQEITVFGEISEDTSKIKQISNAVITVTDTAIQAPTPETITAALTKADVNKLVTISGYLKEAYVDGDSFEIYNGAVKHVITIASLDDLGETIRTAILDALKTYKAGDLLVVTNIVLFSSNEAKVVLYADSNVVKGTAVPADLQNTANSNLTLPKGSDAVFGDIDLVATAGFGTTIVWTSGDTSVIANDGKVTRPAEGQPSATVAMNYVIKFGEEELATGSVNFVVKAIGDDIQTLYVFDFGTKMVSGYDQKDDFEYTNTDGTKIVTKKDRAQINTSTFEPHVDKGAMLVLAPVKDKELAYFEFDLSKFETIKKIQFSFSSWNQGNFDKVKKDQFSLELQVYNTESETWESVKSTNDSENVIDLLTKDAYATVEFNTTNKSKYRIVYSAPTAATGNTTQAICIDNFKILG